MNGTPLLGIFDSGVGGLTVYKKCKYATSANFIYYGDCLRAPYGNREESEIVNFIKEDIAFLQEKGVTHFVNACNSMSVFTTNLLLKECAVDPHKYVDMIRAFEAYADFHSKDIILVIATKATIRSGSYQEALLKKGVDHYTFVYEDLAYEIENNAPYKNLLAIVEQSVKYAHTKGVTHIIYACTHYPLIEGVFKDAKELVGWQGQFIDPAIYVAQVVTHWNITGSRSFLPYSSKDTAVFIKNVIAFL